VIDISDDLAVTIRPLKLPLLTISASFDAIAKLIGDALNMAYVQPYSGLRRREQIVPDDDLDGRDPSW